MSDVIRELHATHTLTSPVFVIGYPRSGTSIICRLMRRYLKVSFGTESQFIIRYWRKLERYGDLTVDANVHRLLGDLSKERFFVRSGRNWGFRFDAARALADVRTRTFAGVLEAVFGQLATHNGMTRWGDKTPQYNDDLDVLLRLFPDAQFVHMVRDGRDVSLSIRLTGFGPKNACESALDWSAALAAIDRFTSRLPAAQFLEVRYEDLTADPVGTLQRLGQFLGIDDADHHVSAYIAGHVHGEIKANNSQKWRKALTPADLLRFEGVAGHWLARYQYDLVHEGRAPDVPPWSRAGWRALGRVQRLTHPGYWSDNLYKLKLRLGR